MRVASGSPLSLPLVYRADAAASGAMGVLLLAAAAPLADALGAPVALLRGAGVILVPFAAFLLWLAGRGGSVARALGWTVVAGNALWTLASLLVLFEIPALTALGRAFVLAQAAAVVTLTALEAAALRTGLRAA